MAKANWLNSGSAMLEYTYDNTDRITQITYPSGRIVLYTRNALGQITQVQTKDDASSPAYTLASEIAYKPFGPVRRVKFGSTLLTTYEYDADYRPTRIQTLSTPLSVRDYSYDAAGNITTITDPFGTRDRAYTYDTIDRLTSDTNTSMAGAFQYDANNNRTGNTLGGAPFTQAYGSTSNRLSSWNGVPVTTDGAGNVTGGGISPITYTYNHANRMSQSHIGGVTTNYLYDGFGLRTAKQGIDNLRYEYLLDGKYAAAIKMNANGTYNQMTEYIWAGDLPIAQIKTSYTAAGAVSSRVVTYIHADHLNTPRMMTDAAKKVVWRWEGDAFGFVNPEEDPDGNGVHISLDLGFPGQLADRDETGLFYNINRYYDPATARYTQSDPIGLLGSPNPYVYANGNTLKYIDTLGLQSFDPGPAPIDPSPGYLGPDNPNPRPGNVPFLPPNLEQRSENCAPYYMVSSGIIPLVAESVLEESECEKVVACTYSGRLATERSSKTGVVKFETHEITIHGRFTNEGKCCN